MTTAQTDAIHASIAKALKAETAASIRVWGLYLSRAGHFSIRLELHNSVTLERVEVASFDAQDMLTAAAVALAAMHQERTKPYVKRQARRPARSLRRLGTKNVVGSTARRKRQR